MEKNLKRLYEFGPFRLDGAERLLLRNGEVVPLTPKAFDVLLALVEQAGHLLGKEELLKTVWPDSFVEESNLADNVSRLRKALGDGENGQKFIETVPRRGYRFVAGVKELSNESAAAVEPPSAKIAEPLNQRKGIKRITIVSVLLLFALVGFGLYMFFKPAPPVQSLAVLPFSADQQTEYLSDGITESLINNLSRLSNLHVTARATAFSYKGKEVNPQQVGQELNVGTLLTGRIALLGDSLIVQVDLIDAATGRQKWGERYQRKTSDIFAVQEEIGRQITERLRLRLSSEEQRQLTKRYTENADAYELYLRGRYHLNKLTLKEVQTSVSYFQQAIVFDPSYALAHVGLADAYSALALSVDMPATEFYPKAKASAEKAIEIDDRLAEAHASLGFAILFYDWDWSAAESQYKRALELNPNSAETHVAYAGLFTVLGRYTEGLAEIKRARELDPLNLRTNALEGRFLVLAGRTDEGLARLRKTIELEPNYFLAHLFASNAYIEKGMYSEAINEATRARDLSGGNAEAIAMIGYALAISGKREEARALLDELKKRSTERYVPPYDFALIHNGLGERDEVFAWLERGVEQRDPKMIFLKGGLQWKNLRDDPRFVGLLERMKLPIR